MISKHVDLVAIAVLLIAFAAGTRWHNLISHRVQARVHVAQIRAVVRPVIVVPNPPAVPVLPRWLQD